MVILKKKARYELLSTRVGFSTWRSYHGARNIHLNLFLLFFTSLRPTLFLPPPLLIIKFQPHSRRSSSPLSLANWVDVCDWFTRRESYLTINVKCFSSFLSSSSLLLPSCVPPFPLFLFHSSVSYLPLLSRPSLYSTSRPNNSQFLNL